MSIRDAQRAALAEGRAELRAITPITPAQEATFATLRRSMAKRGAAKRARAVRDTQPAGRLAEPARGAARPLVDSGTRPGPAIAPLVLVVPMPRSVLNASGRSRHWRTVDADKNAYWRYLDLCAYEPMWVKPLPPPVPLHRVTLTSHMVLGGAMDDDNAIARHKWLLDWLVSRGYLATDRRERKRDGAGCRWAALPSQTVTRKETPRIALTVTPED